MHTRIVRIGNSRGIRIPKSILAQCGIDDSVELSISDGTIVLRPTYSARLGWAEAAVRMSESQDDHLLDPDASTEFDEEEWVW
jgi:antitoxin MazE